MGGMKSSNGQSKGKLDIALTVGANLHARQFIGLRVMMNAMLTMILLDQEVFHLVAGLLILRIIEVMLIISKILSPRVGYKEIFSRSGTIFRTLH
ncbi:hypothetical protein SLEP1_g42953 [Rubroshorea leprosula]|uniref:Uncharacterized protein n=1 Tax=Rubroshorea leprosula TaxID=152421 RepID=A0AAV5LBW4_9ROSI|nr:hypothetical protein SLEP1_g42953 [Rubroshorea leprosula]